MTIRYIAYQVVHQHTEESLAVPCLQVSHGRGESGILASNMSFHWGAFPCSTKYGSCLKCEQTGWGLPPASEP